LSTFSLGTAEARVSTPILHCLQRLIHIVSTGEHERRVQPLGRELARGLRRVLAPPIDCDVRAKSLDQLHAVRLRRHREHPGPHSLGQLHGHVSDAAARADDHE